MGEKLEEGLFVIVVRIVIGIFIIPLMVFAFLVEYVIGGLFRCLDLYRKK